MDNFTDEFLAYLELEQDMLFHKIPQNRMLYYIEEALLRGKKFAEKYSNVSIEDLLQKNQIKIKVDSGDGDFFKVKLRAQFETDKNNNNQILLYKQSVSQLAIANHLPYKEMMTIVLTHEFFHFIEFHEKQTISDQLEQVETFKILNFTRRANISRASEIAAHSFTKEVLHLDRLPNYYDYCYLIKNNLITQVELNEKHNQFLKIKSY